MGHARSENGAKWAAFSVCIGRGTTGCKDVCTEGSAAQMAIGNREATQPKSAINPVESRKAKLCPSARKENPANECVRKRAPALRAGQ